MASPPNVSIEAIEAVYTASRTPGSREQVHHFRCTLADFEHLQLEDRRLDWGFCLEKMHPELRGSSTLGGWMRSWYFGGQYRGGGVDIPSAIYAGETEMWPSIVLEAGYTKSYAYLVDDATLLLEGAEGRIGMAIIVKMEPLKEGETSLQSGFVEVWTIDQENMKARAYGQRQQLYPVPRHHSCQQVPISWQDILGDQTSRFAHKEDPPPLKFDDLRHRLDIAVRRHIRFR